MSQEKLMNVILAPHVSEKSTVAADAANQFVFKVARDASKADVKNAIELLFEVKVDSVNLMNVKGKTKGRFSGNKGRRAHWKKAYVKLAAGSDIDFMSAE